MTTKPQALTVQIGGDHYSRLAIQPMEFSMANNWDACAHTILKYVTRHRHKNGLQDLKKARHCVDMREQLWNGKPPLETVSMNSYVLANNLLGHEQVSHDVAALLYLEDWVLSGGEIPKQKLIEQLDLLIAEAEEDERMKHIVLNGPTGEHYPQT